MKRPENFDALYAEAQRRSGRPDIIEYPVPQAGTSIVVCRLNDDDHRALINGMTTGDEGERATARSVALAAARVWPNQETMTAAIEVVPGLDKALMNEVDRLGGGDLRQLKVVDVRPSLDESAIAALGIDLPCIRALRRQFPHEGQLKIASYVDDELDIRWSCVLRLPSSSATDLMMTNLKERGHETTVTFAVNCMAWPGRDEAAKFIRGQYRIASCLWPVLWAWSLEAAKQRPTIWRPKSVASGASTTPPTSLEKSSATSE
ncbi:MAG: hypothetical protein IPM54_25045 [Polyangiaceae bacterium]|nr:hypothetical protein [Polyangiaceae bacterium]